MLLFLLDIPDKNNFKKFLKLFLITFIIVALDNIDIILENLCQILQNFIRSL